MSFPRLLRHPTPALRVAGLCLLALWVAGCGFRLRGAFDLPPAMAATHVEARGVSGELNAQARRALQAGGARLVASAGEASARLRLLEERSDRRVLSVDTAGQIREYELIYALRFEVRDAAGDELVPVQMVELVRAVTFDSGVAALGRLSEQESVRGEMINMAVNQMMQRIVAVARYAPEPRVESDALEGTPGTGGDAREIPDGAGGDAPAR